MVSALGLPQWILTAVVVAALAGFLPALALAWIFDIGREGVWTMTVRRREAG